MLPAGTLLPEWTAALNQRADLPPLKERQSLMLESTGTAIGSIEPALAEHMAAAGLPLRCVVDAWQIVGAADPALAAMAHWLHANELGGRWREEAMAVEDSAGHIVGSIERAAVRPLGIATRAVHLVGRATEGRVWIQQRALDKATDPGQWDTLMGGLVAHGESLPTTLARETWEEAGLEIGALLQVRPFGEIVVRRPVDDGYMIERIEGFEAVVPEALHPQNQDGEVERFECIAMPELAERLQRDEFTLEASLVLTRWIALRFLA